MTEERSNEEQSVEINAGEAAIIGLPRSTSLEGAGGLWSALRPLYEGLIHFTLFICASISVMVTVGIVVVLLYESVKFFYDVPVLEFLTGTQWTPLLKPQHFGILPLLCGTMLVAGGSAIVAIPIGLGTAIYLSEYASPRVRDIVKPLLEVLAGIPLWFTGSWRLCLYPPSSGTSFRVPACSMPRVPVLWWGS